MDKLTHYRKSIKDALSSYTELANRHPDKSIEHHLIFDHDRDHYMVFRTGWWDIKRVRTPTLYIRLVNEKIWIEEDWTEDGIATTLLKAGISKDDIVLAFHHPKMRPYTEFAVA